MNAQPRPLVRFTLNGAPASIEASSVTRLSEILRERLGLAASKVGCGVGRCGACVVLVDDAPINACLVMAWRLEGADVVTPEGVDRFAEARLLKQALAEENAFQCGYCAPGMVMSLTALLRACPNADEARIRAALEGNICRCTGYHSILRGALRAAELLAARATAGELGDPS
jgi:carbon-monoxide dehydrogenase small subunit